MDFNYLLAQAKLESGLNPSARAGTSSATGLYQFLGSTWLDTLRKHGDEHGLGWASAAADNPAQRAQVMALRYDPDASALMAAELADDNRTALAGALGREPDPTELYLAHFLGQQGATQFLSALAVDPAQSAATLLPAAAGANRAIFFAANGAPRSVGQVMDLVRTRFGAAMEGAGASQWTDGAIPPGQQPPFPGGPVAQSFHATASARAADASGGQSMADTLKQTFGLGGAGEGAVPQHVRTAYGRLAALGL